MGRERSLEPSSNNPLTTALNFIVVILYTFVLQQLLQSVFTHLLAGDIVQNVLDNAALYLLTGVVLLEVLHFATEDYLYTSGLEDRPDRQTFGIDLVQFVIHFLGVICLLGAVYAIIFKLNPDGPLASTSTKTVVVYVLAFAALQNLTFGLWQAADKFRDEVFSTSSQSVDAAEYEHWTRRFSLYAVLLASTAGLLWHSGSAGEGEFLLVCLLTVAGFVSFDRRVGSYRAESQLWNDDVSICLRDVESLHSWRAVFWVFVSLLTVFAVVAVFVVDRPSIEAATVGALVLLTVKADYIFQWSDFYYRIFGIYPRDTVRGS